MMDKGLENFLTKQHAEGMALAAESDLVELVPLRSWPPNEYLAVFRCRGLVRARDGRIVGAHDFKVVIRFPDNYMRNPEPNQVLEWAYPRNVWHPNISDKAPLICLGRLGPRTELKEILYQIFDIITYKEFNTLDPLNPDACAWARQNQHRFPIDRRPLKRRQVDLQVEHVAAAGGGHP